MAKPSDVVKRGLRSAQPTPSANAAGVLYYVTDETILERWSGSAWESVAEPAGGAGSDTDAIHDNVSGEIAALTEKASPVSGDLILIEDSAASNAKKRVLIGNLPGGAGGGDSSYTDVYASRPAASNDGDLFLPSDGHSIERDTGAAWVPWGPLLPLTATPAVSGFTWENQNTAAAADAKGGILFTLPGTVTGGSGYDLRNLYKSAPSTPYTITAVILPSIYPKDFRGGHIGWRQSSDGKLVTLAFYFDVTGVVLAVRKWNSATAFNANYASATWNQVERFTNISRFILRIEDDNTNRKCYFSNDGQNFVLLHTIGRTDFLTGDQVVFGGFTQNTGSDTSYINLISWKEA